MGTGQEQAELWAPGARDWSDYNEPMCTPFYMAVLEATCVKAGTDLLDVGCGGGFALLLAAQRGAAVTGLDATQPLQDIARERVPDATLVRADLEDPLPFDEGSFDVVTAFNSVQYAADPVSVVKNMARVTRPGGLVSFLVWGPPEQCESGALFRELSPLLPPSPPAGQHLPLPHRPPLTRTEVTTPVVRLCGTRHRSRRRIVVRPWPAWMRSATLAANRAARPVPTGPGAGLSRSTGSGAGCG